MKKLESLATETKDDDLFITCSSFEEDRCLALMNYLGKYRAGACIVVHFSSSTTREGELIKRQTADTLITALGSTDREGLARRVQVGPYSYVELIQKITEELRRRDIERSALRVTLDISCFTRIQLVALVSHFLVGAFVDRLRFLYTIPVGYNLNKGDKFSRFGVGCFEPGVIPLRRWSGHGPVTTKRGAVVLLGHEGQRTLSAWRHIDADHTLLVLPVSGYEQIDRTCERENRDLLREADDGRRAVVSKLPRTNIRAASEEIGKWAREFSSAPHTIVSIVPMGPKPLVTAGVLGLLAIEELTTEVVYPMASRYNPNYSWGVQSTVQEIFNFGRKRSIDK